MKLKPLHLPDIAYRTPRNFQLGRAAYRRTPAEEGDHIPTFIQSFGEGLGELDLPRGPPPIALPEARYDLRK
jgi:hypothetical protein